MLQVGFMCSGVKGQEFTVWGGLGWEWVCFSTSSCKVVVSKP